MGLEARGIVACESAGYRMLSRAGGGAGKLKSDALTLPSRSGPCQSAALEGLAGRVAGAEFGGQP